MGNKKKLPFQENTQENSPAKINPGSGKVYKEGETHHSVYTPPCFIH
jgi:hypothetical protein